LLEFQNFRRLHHALACYTDCADKKIARGGELPFGGAIWPIFIS